MPELFRAFAFPCPSCGEQLYHRQMLGYTEFVEHPMVRCPACKTEVRRRRILVLRMVHEANEAISFDCDVCWRSNLTFDTPEKCQYCGATVGVQEDPNQRGKYRG